MHEKNVEKVECENDTLLTVLGFSCIPKVSG